MKRTRFSKNQIIKILKEAEVGVPVTDLCRAHGFSRSSFYKWKAKYGGMEASDLRRLRAVGVYIDRWWSKSRHLPRTN